MPPPRRLTPAKPPDGLKPAMSSLQTRRPANGGYGGDPTLLALPMAIAKGADCRSGTRTRQARPTAGCLRDTMHAVGTSRRSTHLHGRRGTHRMRLSHATLRHCRPDPTYRRSSRRMARLSRRSSRSRPVRSSRPWNRCSPRLRMDCWCHRRCWQSLQSEGCCSWSGSTNGRRGAVCFRLKSRIVAIGLREQPRKCAPETSDLDQVERVVVGLQDRS